MDRPPSDYGLIAPQMCEPYTPPPKKDMSLEGISICAGNGGVTSSPTRRREQQESQDSLGEMLRRGVVKHQLGLSVNLLLFVGLAYVFFPSMRDRLSAFFWLSYGSRSEAGVYGQGRRDLHLVGSFIVFFTALRALSLEYLLLPLAGWFGIHKKKGKSRFAEQSYMMVYYLLYWSWGLLLFIRDTPADVNGVGSMLESLWRGYPQLHLDAGMKLYYLSQFAFWIQQIVVIHIEERRKDHFQMLTHHLITVLLIGGSYPYRQCRVGNAVLVCMDVVDFIFPLAKILKYLNKQRACDAAFAAFVILWLLSRHVAYGAICWSLYAQCGSTVMPYGLYSTKTSERLSDHGDTNLIDNLFQPMLHPQSETVSFHPNIRWLFLGLLLALQCITIAWFVMICRVVMRVLRGEGADDTRSDGEEEAEDEEAGGPAQPSAPLHAMPEAQKEKPRYIEVEASSADDYQRTYPKRKGSGSKRKSKGISSGLNLGEHKEILNRIGCLSEEQLAREREKREDSAGPGPGSAAGRK